MERQGFELVIADKACLDSALAAHAADVGSKLAKSLQAEVGFVHVFEPSVAPGTMWGEPADS